MSTEIRRSREPRVVISVRHGSCRIHLCEVSCQHRPIRRLLFSISRIFEYLIGNRYDGSAGSQI